MLLKDCLPSGADTFIEVTEPAMKPMAGLNGRVRHSVGGGGGVPT